MRWRLYLPVSNNWRQFMLAQPLNSVEDSIPLRVLVLALVIVGIVATDIAAATTLSFWALPLSVVGSFWSGYRRRYSNTFVKFCIAIGMLVALGAFFGRLFGELNDTRLALAELLIQLQVLHSFDMPRRKDLGYSIVIGLILLGVAATLSQTLAFAPLLLLFLAIVLPTLVLDYRSRLGLQQPKLKNEKLKAAPHSIFNLKFFLFNFFTIVALGLAIFAALPRVPGYQLRMFPVSSPIEVKEGFTGRNIINPGYVRQGNGNNQRTGGFGNNSAASDNQPGVPGSVDDTFYYGFNTQINQNLRGEMKPKVVMRVRSQASGFWRVMAFDRYTGFGWEISRNERVVNLQRSPWSYQIFVPPPAGASLTATKEVVQTYTVVSDLPNLIPAMASPKELYFPTPMVALDTEGGLRSPVGLSEDMTYTVVSQVPYRDRTALGKSPTTYPQDIKKYYLQINPEIAEKIKKRTEEIIANYNQDKVSQSVKTLDSAYEKALYLAQYLKQNYEIPDNPLGLPYLGEKDDLVDAFLFKHKGGYPDHFSTALTVMLRSIGIPARLAVGFGSGEFNPFTGMYVVKNTDAYAITEVYFPKYGWFAFDPIPGHLLIPPDLEEDRTFSVLEQFWKWIAGWLPSPLTSLFNVVFGTIFHWMGKAIAYFLALFTQGWLGILKGSIISIALAFCGWLGWDRWQKWRKKRFLQKLPPMEKLYQQMLQWMSEKGLGKHPAQTPLEYVQVVYQHKDKAIASIIDEISQAYVGWRYAGESPDVDVLQQRWLSLKKF